ncbi:MAG TPA: hypothetical protein ENN77_02410 [Candidatus Wirthbacteria bacterium]|nr:hypothetical protein [Candidatus Wirthbacteria bacterium]
MKRYNYAILIMFILLSSLVWYWNTGQTVAPDQSSDQVRIVTSLFPLYDLAKQIGGSQVDVQLLLPPGVDAHSYEPSPADIMRIDQADLFIYTGEAMEPWVGKILSSLSNQELVIMGASAGLHLVELDYDHEHDHEIESNQALSDLDEHAEDLLDHHHDNEDRHHKHDQHGVDPHIWLDFGYLQIIAAQIGEQLQEIDSNQADLYVARTSELLKQLNGLDTAYRETLSTCQTQKIYYGGHYAFGYLASRYDLDYQSTQGFIPEAEPTAQDLAVMIEQIKEHDLKYVFYEELDSPKIAELIANETDAQLLKLNPGQNLSRQAFDSGIGFIEIMEANLANLALGLGCEQKL